MFGRGYVRVTLCLVKVLKPTKIPPVAANEASLYTFKRELCGFAQIINPLVLGSLGVVVPQVIQAGSLMVFSSSQASDPVRACSMCARASQT